MAKNKTEQTNESEQVKLTPQQKKTILEWILYLGKTIIIAIVKKMTGK